MIKSTTILACWAFLAAPSLGLSAASFSRQERYLAEVAKLGDLMDATYHQQHLELESIAMSLAEIAARERRPELEVEVEVERVMTEPEDAYHPRARVYRPPANAFPSYLTTKAPKGNQRSGANSMPILIPGFDADGNLRQDRDATEVQVQTDVLA